MELSEKVESAFVLRLYLTAYPGEIQTPWVNLPAQAGHDSIYRSVGSSNAVGF